METITGFSDHFKSSIIITMIAYFFDRIGDSGIENLLLFQFQHEGWTVDIQDGVIKGFIKGGEMSSAPTKELGKIRDLINSSCRILPKVGKLEETRVAAKRVPQLIRRCIYIL